MSKTLSDYDEIAIRIEEVIATLTGGTFVMEDQEEGYPVTVKRSRWISAIVYLQRLREWCQYLAESHRMFEMAEQKQEPQYVINPIKSAPKDGTIIDIWAKKWNPETDSFEFRRFPDCYWCEPPWDSNKKPYWEGVWANWKPTHWMLKPTPPKEDQNAP